MFDDSVSYHQFVVQKLRIDIITELQMLEWTDAEIKNYLRTAAQRALLSTDWDKGAAEVRVKLEACLAAFNGLEV